jgi:ribonucleotide reductase alpha subunit
MKRERRAAETVKWAQHHRASGTLQRHVDKNSSNLKDKSTDRKTCVHEIENSHLLLSRNLVLTGIKEKD